jgi:phosphoribosylformylglycinamidine synthase
MAPVADVRNSVTPELDVSTSSKLVHVALNDKKRLAESVFSEVTQSNFNTTPDLDDVILFKSMFSSIQEMILNKRILALHDVSDGGLIVSLLEMAFTKKIGLNIQIENLNREGLNDFFFAEEVGLGYTSR